MNEFELGDVYETVIRGGGTPDRGVIVGIKPDHGKILVAWRGGYAGWYAVESWRSSMKHENIKRVA